jgi:hypothetical protein
MTNENHVKKYKLALRIPPTGDDTVILLSSGPIRVGITAAQNPQTTILLDFIFVYKGEKEKKKKNIAATITLSFISVKFFGNEKRS